MLFTLILISSNLYAPKLKFFFFMYLIKQNKKKLSIGSENSRETFNLYSCIIFSRKYHKLISCDTSASELVYIDLIALGTKRKIWVIIYKISTIIRNCYNNYSVVRFIAGYSRRIRTLIDGLRLFVCVCLIGGSGLLIRESRFHYFSSHSSNALSDPN